MMGYTLRYPSELRKAADYFSSIKHESAEGDQLAMAMELIRRNTDKFSAIRFSDGYEAALHALVEAKLKHKPPPREAQRAKAGKVISLMDALRQSIGKEGARQRSGTEGKTGSAEEGGNSRRRKTSSGHRRGITLVKSAAHAGKKAG
jgi:DNA end-binding protein Ku